MHKHTTHFALAIVAAVAWSCSGDGDSQPATGGGGGAGGSAGLSLLVKDTAGVPIDGAGVAIDLLDGERLEGVSDASGEVIFEAELDDIAWYVAHKDGYDFAAGSAAMPMPGSVAAARPAAEFTKSRRRMGGVSFRH